MENGSVSIYFRRKILKRLDEEAQQARRSRSQFLDMVLEKEFKRIDQQKESNEEAEIAIKMGQLAKKIKKDTTNLFAIEESLTNKILSFSVWD